jgi:glycosyltransferase involved in cell wall biosynthesis
LRIFQIIFSKRIDLIICDYPWVGAYAFFAHFLSFKPYIFLEHNIEYEIKQQTKSRYVWLMKLLEIFLSRFAKKVVVVSEKDKDKLIKLGINKKKIVIIENGFDSKRFYPNAKFNKVIRKKLRIGNEPLIFFCGKFDYAPNVEALYNIRWIILPKVLEKIPSAKFVIVGGGTNNLSPELNHPSIIFTGVVDDIEKYLNASDVVIIPITKGGGTRIKILEAIACGKIVITTKKGAEGLINEITRPFLKITDDWEVFSNYIVELVKNPERKRVPKEFVKKYSWKEIYKKFDGILDEFKKNR